MSRITGLWSDFLAAGGRVEYEHPDYLRIAVINAIAGIGGAVWLCFLVRNLWFLPQSGELGRVLIDVFGTLLSIGILLAMRSGASVEWVARLFNAAVLTAILGLLLVRHDAGSSLILVAIYPPLAFLLLDNVKEGTAWSVFTIGVVCALILSGIGPWQAGEAVPTVLSVMLLQTFVMAAYVRGRRQVFERLEELRQRIAHESVHDPLTGLYNRRTFDEFLGRYLARAERGDAALALLLVDIDHFKDFNDRFGHPAGDEALQAVAGAMVGTFARGEDVVFRLGGEELAVLYFAPSREQAGRMAAAVCDAVYRLGLPSPGGPRDQLTISCGLEWIAPGTRRTTVQAYRDADRALYRAKEAGRARYEVVGVAAAEAIVEPE